MKGNRILTHSQVDWKANCLNTVRLIAALSVLYKHGRIHLGIPMPTVVSIIISFFQGVPIFFAMSGFLIWNSIENSGDFVSYAKKRFWRIYPELWVAVALEIVVLLVLYTGPISWGLLGVFAVTQGTVLQFWTPDFLRGYGCGTPNGSLWTIGIFIQFYIVVWFVYKLLHGKKGYIWIAAFIGSVAVSACSPLLQKVLPRIVYKLYRQTFVPYFWLFILGAMAAEKRNTAIPVLKKYWAVLLGISLLTAFVGIDIDAGYNAVCCSALVLGLIGFAYRFPKCNVKVDISYGIYIYHMTVVNAMIALGFTGKPIYLLIVVLISCVLAFVSGRTIGRLSLQKKHKNKLITEGIL